MQVELEEVNIFDTKGFEDAYHYDGDDLGANYTVEKTTFRLWSPTASEASVVLYGDGKGCEPESNVKMESTARGTWTAAVYGDLKGKFYTYKITIGGKTSEAVDPYAKAAGVNGLRGMVVDLQDTDPDGWKDDKRQVVMNPADCIIYELHVRDLSMHEGSGIKNKGKYLGLAEKGTRSPEDEKTGLDHILELGVTHVHLLPVFDFCSIDEENLQENKYNWGYDPQNYNVPEGSYSTDPYSGTARIKELKYAVKTFHDNGLAVVMDVVYNHTGKTQDSQLNRLVPGYYYRMDAEGDFCNGSACNNETASERSMVRKLITDSVRYWCEEYHIDGFRFDLMGLHDIDTMNLIRSELDKKVPGILLYGEGWTGAPSPLPESRKSIKDNASWLNGIAVFNDDMRDGIKGRVFISEDAGFANGSGLCRDSVKFGIVAATCHPQIDCSKLLYSEKPWAKEPSQTVNYVSCHDNNTLWDKILLTNPSDSEADRIKIDLLCNAIVLTSQGIPFLHAGEELLKTKNCIHDSFNCPDSINQLDWSQKSKYKQVFEYYRGLIILRKSHPAFRITTSAEIREKLSFIEPADCGVIAYTINNHANGDSWKTIAVIFNAGRSEKEVVLPAERWGIVADGNYAGVDVIGAVEGKKVCVPAISAMVLADAGSLGIT